MAVAGPNGPVSVRRPWRHRVRQIAWAGVDLVFPPQCAGCHQPGQRFCSACRLALHPLAAPLCEACGYPTEHDAVCRICQASAHGPVPLSGLRSAAFFEGPLQKALHQLKYKRDIILADTLAAILAQANFVPRLPPGLVVPVPLSAERQRERGYNQAALLARAFAELGGRRCVPAGAERVKHTASQVGLSAEERRVNVRAAFRGEPCVVAGQTVILVDDVCTTGATLAACGQALLAAGATAVWGVTLARARMSRAGAQALRAAPLTMPKPSQPDTQPG